MVVFTIGHSTRSVDELIAMLRSFCTVVEIVSREEIKRRMAAMMKS
jgi:hypothetical protein